MITQQEFNTLSTELKIAKALQITCSLTTNELNHPESLVIPDDLQSFTLLSMEVSPFPTESRKVMKYIETEQLEKFIDKNSFVQVDNYSVVFANVEDLSYHNFENILNLDHLFNDVSFQMTSKSFSKSKKIQIFNMEGSMEALLSLDNMNYYTVPLNNTQRGGRRLIFHSNQLSYALTQMIEKSKFFDKNKFSHVNNVFRLNNFAPGDKKFKAHYDTPYADKFKNQYSKYTILIYLTGNSNSKRSKTPPLTIEDFVIKSIKDNDCIIFDQSCQHEGNAYLDRNKIFIRTELIYEVTDFEYDEKVARMFNTACYMTKEIEQQQYSADLFNNCVKMRYRLCEEKVPKIYLAKRCLNIMFVTDGNYYWFQKDIDLESIATLIILDYFNAKVYDLKNIKIQSKVLPRKNAQLEEESDENIFNFIEYSSFTDDYKNNQEKIQKYNNPEKFIPDSLCEEFITFKCTFHQGGCSTEDETSKKEFQQAKKDKMKELKSILNQHSVLIFDNQIIINQDKIKVQIDDQASKELSSGKIRFSNFYLKSEKKINFASCDCDFRFDYEDIVMHNSKKLHSFCLPDISFQTLPNGIKLSVDIFNNGFIYHSTDSFEQPYTNLRKLYDEYDRFFTYNEDEEELDENENNQSDGSYCVDKQEDDEENEDEEDDEINQNNLEDNRDEPDFIQEQNYNIDNSENEIISSKLNNQLMSKHKITPTINHNFEDTTECQLKNLSINQNIGLMEDISDNNQNNFLINSNQDVLKSKHDEEQFSETQLPQSLPKKRSFPQQNDLSYTKQKKTQE